jgi:hypothetical protein
MTTKPVERLVADVLARQAASIDPAPPGRLVSDTKPPGLLVAAVLLLVVGVAGVWWVPRGSEVVTVDRIPMVIEASPVPRVIVDLPGVGASQIVETIVESLDLVLVDRTLRYGGPIIRIAAVDSSEVAGDGVTVDGRPARLDRSRGTVSVEWTSPSGQLLVAESIGLEVADLLEVLAAVDVIDGEPTVTDPSRLGSLTVAPDDEVELLRYVALLRVSDDEGLIVINEIDLAAGPIEPLLTFTIDGEGPKERRILDVDGQQVVRDRHRDGIVQFGFSRGFWSVAVIAYSVDDAQVADLVRAIRFVDEAEFRDWVGDRLVAPDGLDAATDRLVAEIPTPDGFEFDRSAFVPPPPVVVWMPTSGPEGVSGEIARQTICAWIRATDDLVETAGDVVDDDRRDQLADEVVASLRQVEVVSDWGGLSQPASTGATRLADRVALDGLPPTWPDDIDTLRRDQNCPAP